MEEKAYLTLGNTLNGPIWYINVLMLCYIISFFLSKMNKKYNSMLIFTIPIIIGIFMIYSNNSFVLWNVSIARGLISFFIGILLGKIFEYIKAIDNKKVILLKTILGIELTIFIIILTMRNREIFIDKPILCYSFLFFPELLILLYNVKWLNNICKTKIIKFLGNISFGIYLWNFPILLAFHMLYIKSGSQIPITSWQFILINSIVHVIVATISYLLIDKTLVVWLKKAKVNNETKLLETSTKNSSLFKT